MSQRDAVSRLHGGPDALGVPRHDFSTNSNACGPCPLAVAALQACDASHYSDPAYTALRQQLADFHGVALARVLLAGSASEFIFRMTAAVAQLLGGPHPLAVRVPTHAYGDYAAAALAWGFAVVTDVRTARNPPVALQWHTDPASPLGQSQALEVAAHEMHPLVVDRAYEPLRLSGAPAVMPAQMDACWQLWTPNKALGLTGVRAAYAIAPLAATADQLIATLHRLCPSWPIGAHGVALLQAWVQPPVQAWLADSLSTLRGWKARQIQLLQGLGWICLPSDTNFFCAQPPQPLDITALRTTGLKLRDATSFGLSGWLRLAVLSPLAQDALAASLLCSSQNTP